MIKQFTITGGDGGGNLAKTNDDLYINPLGLDRRLGVRVYLQTDVEAYTAYGKNLLANLGRAYTAGKWVQCSFDPSPVHPAKWAINNAEAKTYYAPVMNPYWQAGINGAHNAQVDAWCQWVKDNNLNHPDVSIVLWHEQNMGPWYNWTPVANPSLCLAYQKVVLRRLRQNGIVCDLALDYGDNASYGIDVRVWADTELLGLIDSFSIDPYYEQSNPASAQTSLAWLGRCITHARSKGKGVYIGETGGLYHANDAALKNYFAAMYDLCVANGDVVRGISHYVVQPEDTKTLPNGTVLNGSNGCDYLRQIPRPYPLTKTYMVNTFMPNLIAAGGVTVPPPVDPPPGGPMPAITSQTVDHQTVTIKSTYPAGTKANLWSKGARVVPEKTTDAAGTVVWTDVPVSNDIWPTVGTSSGTVIVTTAVTPPPVDPPDDPRDQQIADLEAQVAALTADRALLQSRIVAAKAALG